MPARGLEEFTRIFDDYYRAIYQSRPINRTRQYSPAELYTESFEVNNFTEAVFAHPAFPYRGYRDLGIRGTGGLFNDDGYLPQQANLIEIQGSLFDLSGDGTNIVLRVERVSGGATQVLMINSAGQFRLRFSGTILEALVGSVTSQITNVADGIHTIAMHVTEDAVNVSLDSDAYIETTGGGLAAGYTLEDVVVGANDAGANLIEGRIRWMMISQSPILDDDQLDYFHSLSDEFYEDRGDLITSDITLEEEFLDGATMLWPCVDRTHIALAVAGEGYASN